MRKWLRLILNQSICENSTKSLLSSGQCCCVARAQHQHWPAATQRSHHPHSFVLMCSALIVISIDKHLAIVIMNALALANVCPRGLKQIVRCRFRFPVCWRVNTRKTLNLGSHDKLCALRFCGRQKSCVRTRARKGFSAYRLMAELALIDGSRLAREEIPLPIQTADMRKWCWRI